MQSQGEEITYKFNEPQKCMQGSGKLYSALQLLKDNDNKCFIICSYFRLVQKCNLCPPFSDYLYRICSFSLQLQENRINIIYLRKKKKKLFCRLPSAIIHQPCHAYTKKEISEKDKALVYSVILHYKEVMCISFIHHVIFSI